MADVILISDKKILYTVENWSNDSLMKHYYVLLYAFVTGYHSLSPFKPTCTFEVGED